MVNVAIDTCVIIDLADARDMEALNEVPNMFFHLTDSVDYEVCRPAQRVMLEAEIAKGAVSRIRVDDWDALCLYARLRDKNDEGECACLALADMNGWHIATSETNSKFMNAAVPLIGAERIIRTADILRHRQREAAE